MKKLVIILWLFPIALQAQNWQWANQIGTPTPQGSVYGKVITDGLNSYLIGEFRGTLNLQTDTFNSLGFNDMFIIKYDSNGNELWAKGFGGNNSADWTYEDANGVYDPICNCIYIAGKFYGSMYLSPTITLNGNAYAHLFLAKIDLDGNFQWAKKIDSTVSGYTSIPENYAYIFTEPDGDVVLAGRVNDTSYFDTFLVNPGGFLARYDNSGICKWAEHKFSGPEEYKTPIFAPTVLSKVKS